MTNTTFNSPPMPGTMKLRFALVAFLLCITLPAGFLWTQRWALVNLLVRVCSVLVWMAFLWMGICLLALKWGR
jgi:hypothetical protein